MPEQCQWFALCANPATTTRSHPILGDVPICERCDVKVDAIDSNEPEHRIRWRRLAYKAGEHAAQTAATWTTDGNQSSETRQEILRRINEGDPAADDMLPAQPNLSGEWADDLTPEKLLEEITGQQPNTLKDEDRETILNAWEDGVSDEFLPACERELLKAEGR